MFSELLSISHLEGKPRIRYARMLGLLRRACLEASEDFKSDYATLFSRLIAVCRVRGIDHRPADRFRRNARLVLSEQFTPTQEEERADLADLCHFIMQLTGKPIPANLPQHIRPLVVKAPQKELQPSLRGIITDIIDNQSFRCRLEKMDYECKVEFWKKDKPSEENTSSTRYLYKGANVMLLDVKSKNNASDTLLVNTVILEPDYLIDVSALTATMKPYGSSPLNYLLNQFAPKVTSKSILLGNLANQFMDDCINDDDTEQVKKRAYKKNFQQYIMEYACLSDNEINPNFFKDAERQYANIRDAVNNTFQGKDVGLKRDELLLEPSFICPTLGLRGRLDVMSKDHQRFIELKSGKCEENFHHPIGPKKEHRAQMSLYREILRYNFQERWEDNPSFLFYSAYPIFYSERLFTKFVYEALDLRNGIVNLIHCITQELFEKILPLLTLDHLYTTKVNKNLFENFLRPQIEKVTIPLRMLDNDELLRIYFTSYLTFIERELFMSKTSDNRPDSIRGFAATWTADRSTKLMAGNLLTGLTISRIERDEENAISVLHFRIPPYKEEFIPNFNPGEMVQIYEAINNQANVTNQQLIRGTVTHISAQSLTIELAYKQRNQQFFSTEKTYAAEHDSSDAPNTQQVRNLFSLLTATEQRRDLLLAKRQPEVDLSRSLCGSYPEAVHDIVLHAKQARDYFLLVGPPGTGKTNLALRSMVKEFLLTRELMKEQSYGSLLLTAYTNKAVDEICSMLNNLAEEISFDYLRIGTKQTCASEYHSHLLSERALSFSNRIAAREMIDLVPIVVGTVITLTNQPLLFQRKHFVAAIIDEASQLLEPQALGLLCAKKENDNAIDKFILIGDHKQLPAVVMLPEKQTIVTSPLLKHIGLTNLRNSLFQRLHQLALRNKQSAILGTLRFQGRMHPDICQFVSHYFYKDTLQPVPLNHQKEKLNWTNTQGKWEKFVATTRMGFVDVKPLPVVENLRANAPEAEVVCNLIEAIVSLHKKKETNFFNPSQAIGVIVPFRSQIASVRGALRNRGFAEVEDMTIDTVECFQGSQRDYIIFSTTISEPYQLSILSSEQLIEGSLIDRKLNVAITRARLQFFMVGNRKLLEKSLIYKALISTCRTFET